MHIIPSHVDQVFFGLVLGNKVKKIFSQVLSLSLRILALREAFNSLQIFDCFIEEVFEKQLGQIICVKADKSSTHL